MQWKKDEKRREPEALKAVGILNDSRRNIHIYLRHRLKPALGTVGWWSESTSKDHAKDGKIELTFKICVDRNVSVKLAQAR